MTKNHTKNLYRKKTVRTRRVTFLKYRINKLSENLYNIKLYKKPIFSFIFYFLNLSFLNFLKPFNYYPLLESCNESHQKKNK
jgi:hypothetical protein